MLEGIPLGHDIPSHVVHGWCYHCRDRTVIEEATAWRLWSMTHVSDVAEALSSRDGNK